MSAETAPANLVDVSAPPAAAANANTTDAAAAAPEASSTAQPSAATSDAAAHINLDSKERFQEALQTKDKYVLIYAYTGDVSPQAEEAARRHAHNTVAYKVDVDQFPTAKENLKLTEFPAVVVFKDGQELKRAEGLNPEKAAEIAAVLV